jgi:hypothetical protein
MTGLILRALMAGLIVLMILDWPQCVLLLVLKEERERWSTGAEHYGKRSRVINFL